MVSNDNVAMLSGAVTVACVVRQPVENSTCHH